MATEAFVDNSGNLYVTEILYVLDAVAVLPCNVDTIQDLLDEYHTAEERPVAAQELFDRAIEWLTDKKVIAVDSNRVVTVLDEKVVSGQVVFKNYQHGELAGLDDFADYIKDWVGATRARIINATCIDEIQQFNRLFVQDLKSRVEKM